MASENTGTSVAGVTTPPSATTLKLEAMEPMLRQKHHDQADGTTHEVTTQGQTTDKGKNNLQPTCFAISWEIIKSSGGL